MHGPGKKGGEYKGVEREEKGRSSKDRMVNGEGKRLIEAIEEMGWAIWNGNTVGDEEGEYTFVGARGETVIDYVIGGSEAKEKVRRLEVGDRIDSDHHPIIVEIETVRWERKKEKKGRKLARGNWTREGRERFRREVKWREEEGKGINEEIELRTGEIRRVIDEEAEREEGEERVKRGWWDEETKNRKREVRKTLREWRKKEIGKERYKEEKREYNKLCEKKKQEENERFIREAEEARTESKLWEVLNRERRKRKKIDKSIEASEWKEYFMSLLEGTDRKAVTGDTSEGREEDGEGEIKREEVRKAMTRLKDGKAPGRDEIVNEVWRYGGWEAEEWVWRTCNRVWRGEGWPEAWKGGWIVPIVKSGEGRRVEEHRGVTLMSTMYKIYASVTGASAYGYLTAIRCRES